MRRAMLIDLRTCIGCHACSVACKVEFDVPLGVYRDTVKYVESGKYRDGRCGKSACCAPVSTPPRWMGHSIAP